MADQLYLITDLVSYQHVGLPSPSYGYSKGQPYAPHEIDMHPDADRIWATIMKEREAFDVADELEAATAQLEEDAEERGRTEAHDAAYEKFMRLLEAFDPEFTMDPELGAVIHHNIVTDGSDEEDDMVAQIDAAMGLLVHRMVEFGNKRKNTKT